MISGNCDCCGGHSRHLERVWPMGIETFACALCREGGFPDDDCTCTMSSVNSASIDPPHEVVNKNCPIHGNAAARDPDAAYEASRDDPPEPFWMEDDS